MNHTTAAIPAATNRERETTTMKKTLTTLGAGLALVAACFVGAPTGSVSAAEKPATCYSTVAEYQYEHTYEELIYGDVIVKETHTLLEDGSYTDWKIWNGDKIKDDGRARSGHHGGKHGEPGDRDYRYVVVGQYEKGSTTLTETSDWTTEESYKDWKRVGERKVDGEQIACDQPSTPKPKVTDWEDGPFKCEALVTTQTRATTTFGWKLDGFTWVPTEETTYEYRDRKLTDQEVEKNCIQQVKAEVIEIPPTCDAPGTIKPKGIVGINWKEVDGVLSAGSDYGYQVVGQTDFSIEEYEKKNPKLTGEECEDTTIPDTTVPDTTVPDTTIPDTTVPDTTVPDTTVPDTTVPPSAAQPSNRLPSTGTTSNVLMAIGGLFVISGIVTLLFISRFKKNSAPG